MAEVLGGSRHYQVTRFRLYEGREHGSNPAEINARDREADKYCCRQQQDVLDQAHPRHPTDTKAATTPRPMIIAGMRWMAPKLATSTIRPKPVS